MSYDTAAAPQDQPAKADTAQKPGAPGDVSNPYAPFQNNPLGIQQFWQREMEAGKKERKDFDAKSVEVIRALIDKRGIDEGMRNHINLFWSTYEVQKASLYARVPKVDVTRTHRDSEDDVARVASIMLERILNCGIEKDGSDFDASARHGITDYLTVGLGQVWYRYDSEIGKQTIEPTYGPTPPPPQTDPMTGLPAVDPATGAPMPAPQPQVIDQGGTFDVKLSEDSPTDYVYWRDFIWSPCRTWEENRWVAKRVFKSKAQATKLYGAAKAELLSYRKQAGRQGEEGVGADIDNQAQAFEKAELWEIWCKDTKRVYWFAFGQNEILKFQEDMLGLEGFFPCPEPLTTNTTTSRFMPKSDYMMAVDLFKQINEIQTRLSWLVKACKVAGLYDKNSVEIKNIYKQGELSLVGVDNWAMFAEKGGIQGQVTFLPIQEIAEVISQLRVELQAAQQHVYEVLGISDIMRGASDPNETLGAQELKAQFGSSRIQSKQSDIAMWIARGQRIKAEIISKHYDAQTIINESNIMSTPDKALAQQAADLIKNAEMLKWKISVDPDTIAALDWAKEREARSQFLEAVGAFIEKMSPLAMQAPAAAPFLFQLFQWAMGGFKVSKEIEGVLDQCLQALQQGASQPKQPTPQDDKIKSETAKNMATAQKTSVETQNLQNPVLQILDKLPQPAPVGGHPGAK